MYILIKEQADCTVYIYICIYPAIVSRCPHQAPPSPQASANIRATSSKSFKDISGERWEPRTSLDPLDLLRMAVKKCHGSDLDNHGVTRPG